jgi:hypothetical protein
MIQKAGKESEHPFASIIRIRFNGSPALSSKYNIFFLLRRELVLNFANLNG